MNDEPVIRAGESRDAARIASLILMSDSGLLPALFGPRVHRTLERLVGARGNPFSFEHTLVVTRGDVLVGTAVGMKRSEMSAENLSTAVDILRFYGLSAPVRLFRLSRASVALRSLGPADFYLSNIAINPEYRSSGLGGWLLGTVEERASGRGILRMVLDCDPENVSALRFYYRLGYEEEGEHEIAVRGRSARGKAVRDTAGGEHRACFTFRRMVKRL